MLKKEKITAILMTVLIASSVAITGCGSETVSDILNTTIGAETEDTTDAPSDSDVPANAPGQETKEGSMENNFSQGSSNGSSATLIDASSMFSDRDLEQEADLTDATYITLSDGEDVNITEEGVYVISGSAKETSIIVEADETAKVQLVLDGVSITNSDFPAIYVKSADKVFVTTTDSDNTLKVTDTFTSDDDTNTDAVIFSKDDLVLNGKGTLTIESSKNGITSKDDLKITGGTYNITASSHGLEANEYLGINDGTLNIYASEGMEATYVQINDGTIHIEASDDGINATQNSTDLSVVIEVNGGDITINMGSGDTDGFDSNGDIYINGGKITVTGNSAFDWDGEAQLNGGTVIVNGEEVSELTNQFMGGQGGPGGQMQGGQAPEGFDGQMPESTDGQMQGGPNGQMQGGPGGQMQGGPGGQMQGGQAPGRN